VAYMTWRFRRSPLELLTVSSSFYSLARLEPESDTCRLCLHGTSKVLRATRSFCLFTVFSLLPLVRTHALDPSLHISQYGHTAWRIQDGFFNGAPTAIAQTADGYLWVGTADGLFRFDGARFVPFADPAGQNDLQSAEISALLGARDGSLWIGAGYRFYRWKDQVLTRYSTGEDQFVDSIVESAHGVIWLTRERYSDMKGPLCRVQGQGLHCYSQNDGIPFVNASSLIEDSTGSLWIGDDDRLVRWRPGRSTTWKINTLRQSEGLNGVSALAEDRNGFLWVGLTYPGPGLGLQQFRDGNWKTFLSARLNGSRIAVTRLYPEPNGALWVGTDGHGLYRIVDGRADHFGSSDGLSGDKITAIFQDHEGTLWVGTSMGIDSFRDLPVVTVSRREGLYADDARSILSSSDGAIWIGNQGALDVWRNGVINPILPKDGLPGKEVTSILDDPAGGLWVGVDSALFHLSHGRFLRVNESKAPSIVFTMANGADGSLWVELGSAVFDHLVRISNGRSSVTQTFAAGESVLALAVDHEGRIWVAGDKLRYLTGSGEKTISEFGPRYGYIRNIAVDGSDFVWFGATKGLVGFKDEKMQVMTAANGLPCERINTLILDDRRALWLYAQCGLIRIDHNELERWWRHPDVPVSTTVFDAMDGFRGGPSSFRPAATKSSDGRLWFVNGSVVQTIDPSHLDQNGLPPPVHIEQVIADTKEYSPGTAIRCPRLTRNLEIKYTGLSFVVPQRVHFRYKLESYDTSWQNAGSRRSAFYTNLRPGNYRFLVIACNNSGVWNSEAATLTFVILPAWYQTIWFRLFALLFLILLSYAFYLLRTRQYAAAMRVRFSERLDERTRIARELHDTLLQSFHGLMFRFQAARNLMPQKPDSAMQVLDEAISATERALAEGRDAIRDLRLEQTTERDLAELLTAAGQELALAPAEGHTPEFRVIVEGKPRQLVPTLEEEVYRIGREVILNAFRHAAASHIEVEVSYDEDRLRLRIRDDGKGMDCRDLESSRRSGHWGLPGARERAQRIGAQLEFWSETGAGTEMELRIPAAVAYKQHRDRRPLRLFRYGGHGGGRA